MPNRLNRYFDSMLSVAIFVVVAVAAGRVYRFPFDDEIYTFSSLKFISAGVGAARFLMSPGEMNPHLSHLMFYAGSIAGLDTPSLRWISLGCTAGALAIWHWMTVGVLDEPGSSVSISTSIAMRLLIAILFGLTPLAISQGDALRWYPPLALMIAIALATYLGSARRWFLSGVAFGLAADTGFLALLPFLAVLVHRYLIKREFRWREDLRFHLLTILFAVPGFVSFLNVVRYNGYDRVLAIHYTPGILRRVLESSLGFFGGVTLGVSQAWIVALAIAATAYLAYRAATSTMRDRSSARLCSVVLITVAFAALFTLMGFSEPRGYLFLSPMMSALTAIGFVYATVSSPRLATASYAALLVASVAVASNLRSTDTPFKRNAAIPFAEVIDFVRRNQRGKTVLMTTDATIEYSLSGTADLCVVRFVVGGRTWEPTSCSTGTANETVIIVKGAPLDEADPNWNARVAAITAGRSPIAEAHFGRDDDAALKNRLSGTRLSTSILDATVYR